MSAFSKADGSSSRVFSWGTKAVALAATGFLLASCASGGGSSPSPSAAALEVADYTLKIGTSLPQTGNLAYLGPPEEAGVALAVADINAAGTPVTIDVTYGDSGDTDNKAYETEIPRVLNEGVSAIIGAASSGVTKQFIDQVTAAGVIVFSPANTSADFTTWDDKGLYWRTAPSDTLQGAVAGNLIAEDGNTTLGQIIINDSYGTGLADFTKQAFEEAGGEVVDQEYYNVGDTSFDAQVSALLAAKPDAIQVVAFDETKTIIPALVGAGFPSDKLYLVDGNLADYSAADSGIDHGMLTGAKGTLPGLDTNSLGDFTTRLDENWESLGNDKLTDFSYAAESYDAVVLTALASLAAGGSTDGATIAAQLQAVSEGGTKYTDFASAAKAVLAGEDIDYDGFSGPITFDENGDPTEATIGIFQYNDDNTMTRLN